MKKVAAVVVSTAALVSVGVLARGGTSLVPAQNAVGSVGAVAAPAAASSAAAAGLGSAGTGSTPADQRTWVAIVKAVHDSPLTDAVPDTAYTVVDIRRSVSDPSWAAATVESRRPDLADHAFVVLHVDGRSWRVRDLGTLGVGCGIAPAPVLRDLDSSCPAD